MPFRDAARRIATAEDPSLLPEIERVCKGLITGSTPTPTPTFALMQPDNPILKLVDRLNVARRAAPSAIDRRLRLLADHTLTVIKGWLVALNRVSLPDQFDRLPAGTMAEIPGHGRVPFDIAHADLVTRIVTTQLPIVGPHQGWPDLSAAIDQYFEVVLDQVAAFARSVGAEAGPPLRSVPAYVKWVSAAGAVATSEYRSGVDRLAAENHELALWINLSPASSSAWAAGDNVQNPIPDGSGLRGLIDRIAVFDPPPEDDGPFSTALIRLSQADFRKKVIDPTEHAISPDLTLPPLCDAYVNPVCRTTSSSPQSQPFDHQWWPRNTLLREDIETFLLGYLTYPPAFDRPLLVLGDPGAGKSVLARGLAAAVTAGAWLPIMVRLRHAPSNGTILVQVESALHEALKRPVSWAELVEEAAGRTPLLLLDGFDELLQTTSASRADYLEEIERFQESETAAGRKVAVVVTSRTAMAHRARIPFGSLVLRIEPLDRDRAERWLSNWNQSISGYLGMRGLRRLGIDVVWRHQELASQPLLLLLLAIHDSVANEVQHAADRISQGDLYERLISGFVHREMRRHYPADDSANLADRVERELDFLSYTSFAMFNRARQSVSEQELDEDLVRLADPTGEPGDQEPADPARLRPAQLLLGRFFFIHESMSTHDTGDPEARFVRLRTYEFLHATFGEYLIARLVVKATRGLALRAGRTSQERRTRADGALLQTLLSFRPLTGRGKILDFIIERFALFNGDTGYVIMDALFSEFHRALIDPSRTAYRRYAPAPTNIVQRLACYTHNIAYLIGAVGKPLVDVSDIFAGRGAPCESAVTQWHRIELIWRAGMDDGAWRTVQDGLFAIRVGPGRVLIGLADRLIAGTAAVEEAVLVETSQDAPQTLTPHEVPSVRRLLAPFFEVSQNWTSTTAPVGSAPARALLQLISAETVGSPEDGSISSRDADYVACIASAYEVPLTKRRAFVAAIAHELAKDKQIVRNRPLLETLLLVALTAGE